MMEGFHHFGVYFSISNKLYGEENQNSIANYIMYNITINLCVVTGSQVG